MWCHIKGPWFYFCPNYVLLITCIKVSFAESSVVFKMSWTQNSVRVTAWIINFHFLIDEFFSVVSSCRWPIGQLASCTFLQKETLSVHQIPDARVGEGVPVQHVPHARSATWGGARTQSDRAAGEDLVPEPEDENEETKQGPIQGLAGHKHSDTHACTHTHTSHIPKNCKNVHAHLPLQFLLTFRVSQTWCQSLSMIPKKRVWRCSWSIRNVWFSELEISWNFWIISY